MSAATRRSAQHLAVEASTLAEEEKQHDSGGKTAQVREPCDARPRRRSSHEAGQSIEKLQKDVDAQEDVGGNLDEVEEDDDGHEREHLRPRKQEEVRAEYSRYRAARSEHRHGRRPVSEYVRHGSVSAFVIYAPLEGRRETYISERGTRTAQDYAATLEFIASEMFPKAEKILLVEDNLNTHCDASLYAAFAPKRARELALRFERHHTPKHGSWLNIAESEISALVRTGLKERIETCDELRQQLNAVVQRRNLSEAKTNWQFRTEDARVKLHGIYPSLQS